MSPDICIEAQRSYDERTKPPLHSGFVGRPPATLEMQSPINLRKNNTSWHLDSPHITQNTIRQVLAYLQICVVLLNLLSQKSRGRLERNQAAKLLP